MREALFLLATVVILILAPPALADGIEYTVTGPAFLFGVEVDFTLNFTEPTDTLGSLSTFTTASFTDTQGLSLSNLPAQVMFYPEPLGLFGIELTLEGIATGFEFTGPQIYSGSSAPFALSTGSFPITFVIDDYNDHEFQSFGGSVTATAVPEPATIVLLSSGLFLIGVALGWKFVV